MTLRFGENLSFLRKINKLEQKDVAKLVHKTVSTVSAWERGKRESTVRVLCIPVLSCFFALNRSFLGHFCPFFVGSCRSVRINSPLNHL